MKYELVIFDCDGVLVNSEPLACRMLAEHATRLGWDLSAEEAEAAFRGHHISTTMARIEEETGAPLPEGWLAAYRAELFELLAAEVEAVPGVEEVLRWLKQREIEVCVASQAPYAKMRVTLGRTGLMDLVEDWVFSADMVARPKPAPDLFLYAAGRMGVEPNRACVIEDSTKGVEGAKAALMDVYGYAADDKEGRLAEAGATIFQHMSELPDLLAATRPAN